MWSWFASIMRASAGILSPSSNIRMSPGTTSSAGICICLPSRRTRAWGLIICWSASTARSALYFWMKLTVALRITIAKMTVASVISPNAYAREPATIRIMTIKSKNSSINWNINGFLAFVLMMFGPISRSFFCTCWRVRPSGLEWSSS